MILVGGPMSLLTRCEDTLRNKTRMEFHHETHESSHDIARGPPYSHRNVGDRQRFCKAGTDRAMEWDIPA
jgi:hypothetical protein